MMDDRERLVDFLAHPCNSENTCQPCRNCKVEKRKILEKMDGGHTHACAVRMILRGEPCTCVGGTGGV